ncbi:MAG: TetR/AcrR family transcriptional regulator [Oscillospiraceae bacterium]|nr:TetR/AcrR family transcriptional regulator [Oscillospiraceae bacterium]
MDIELSDFLSYNVFGSDYSLPFGSEKVGTKESILVYSTVLFAMHGYTGVSMKDIAAKIGIQAASLYNHFPSKESLWEAVVEHTVGLYRLYHDSLNEQLLAATSLEQVLDLIFVEPERMTNNFTCFAFSLIQFEQLHDEKTWQVYNEVFLEYPASIYIRSFERCIKLGYVRDFDVTAVSHAILCFILQQVNIYTQKLMGRTVSHDPLELIARYHKALLQLLLPDSAAAEAE